MKLDSYCTDSAPAFVPRSRELPAQVDVQRRLHRPVGGAGAGEAGGRLRTGLAQIFPQFGAVRLGYCWGGLVDMTQDRLPHAGERNGLDYAMGYSGHGTQMSVHMGERMAALMGGDVLANPWESRDWRAIPGHLGPPWFLPAIGLYYAIKDRLA